jgi:plastocyanin
VRIRRFGAGMALALLLAVVVGGPASAATANVSEVDFDFVPATTTINVGDTVVWTNNGDSPHTSTSDSGAWDSGSMDPGQTFSQTFNSAGTFPYHCNFHQSLGMVGTIVVQGAPGTTPPGGSTSPPLPNTGSGPLTVPLAILGGLFLLTGATLLYRLRRRA